MKTLITSVINVRATFPLCCGVAVLAVSPALAAVTGHLYVATTGADSNPGTPARPVKTIGRADALARPGFVIHVAAGTYKVAAPSAGDNGIKTTTSGTAADRIKFVSDVKWGAKIVLVSGAGIAWNSMGSYVDIEGFDVSGSGRLGLAAGGAHLTIRHNLVHDLTISGGCTGGGGAGILTYGPVGDVVIDRNVVRNIGYKMLGSCPQVQGIYISNAKNIVTNNIVSGVAAVGIHQWHGATDSTIVNNTTFHNNAGILLGQGDAGATSSGSENNYVANNIVYDNKTYGIYEAGKLGGNNRYRNNLVTRSNTNWRVKGDVLGTVSCKQPFVKYQANGLGNYRLARSSPAIDGGTSIKAPSIDFAGVSRPRGAGIDIGAYEF